MFLHTTNYSNGNVRKYIYFDFDIRFFFLNPFLDLNLRFFKFFRVHVFEIHCIKIEILRLNKN